MVSLKYLLALLPLALTLAAPSGGKDPVISGKYIVTLKAGVKPPDIEDHISWVSEIHARSLARRDEKGVEKVWTKSFKGYCGQFDKATVEEIASSDDVVAVEPVKLFKLSATVTQNPSTWGLGSISHRNPNWRQYLYDDLAGAKQWAYVVDTGLNTGHVDFEGRAFLGYNAYPGVPFVDVNGHGTHCAGTIASKTYGVSKRANVISVKVFDTGSSSTDIVLDGYEWAVANITNTPGRAASSVISMSLSGGRSPAFNNAVEAAFRQNVLTVVAAGNSYADASAYSPASAPNALTIGAVDIRNNKPAFSNFGAVVDLFAPGVDIPSTWIGSNMATNIISGTSMACPHVAGLALYLRAKEGLTTAVAVTNRIKTLATRNVVANAGANSPNLLAYNGIV
ncbi:hypothetical protein G7046_g2963 [Stylonectria norvegica]|nr:hypothetical protein G7046_g2963 [Stylonectria norvegica]